MVLYLDRMYQRGLHAVLWSLIRYTYAPPRCRTLQYSRTFIPFSVSLWNDLANPYSTVWDWRVSRAGPMLLYWPKLHYPTFFPFLFFLSIGWYCGAGVFGLIGCIPLSLSLALPTFFNNNNNNTVRDHGIHWDTVRDHGIYWGTVRDHGIYWGTVRDHGIYWGTVRDPVIYWGTVRDHGIYWGTVRDHGI